MVSIKKSLNRTWLTKSSRSEDPQKLDTMPRSKEMQDQMRKKVIDIEESGKGSKAISKALGSTIHKWLKHGIVVKLPRSGQPSTKMTHPRTHKRPHNNIQRTAGLTCHKKETGGRVPRGKNKLLS